MADLGSAAGEQAGAAMPLPPGPPTFLPSRFVLVFMDPTVPAKPLEGSTPPRSRRGEGEKWLCREHGLLWLEMHPL